MNLHESVEAILDAIVAAIEAATAVPGSGLEDVKSVVRGERARPMPLMPAVWVVPQPAEATQSTYGNEEAWRMPVALAALVKADDAETGTRTAQRIAARAAGVAKAIHADPSLDGCEVDVRMRAFDGAARSTESNRNLFWTDATIVVTFVVDDAS